MRCGLCTSGLMMGGGIARWVRGPVTSEQMDKLSQTLEGTWAKVPILLKHAFWDKTAL